MYIANRAARFVRGFLMSYGPKRVKEVVWDKEFAGGKWNFIDNTATDCVYPFLERHARKGDILDLGCGPGNTANELVDSAYQTYLGVDISQEALAKATQRTAANGRAHKNRFAKGDFLKYEPDKLFDVVLFRESMYHIPLGKIKPVLSHYAQYLKEDGVFVVRMALALDGKSKFRPTKMVSMIESTHEVVEKGQFGDSETTVIVFRPKRSGRKN